MVIREKVLILRRLILSLVLMSMFSCTWMRGDTYQDPDMDFGAIRRVAVMPFENLARDKLAAERVRDVFITLLLSTEAVYVLPVGEVARGIARLEMLRQAAPSPEEIIKLSGIIEADAVITGVVREYGEVRSGSTAANVISLSLQMTETQTGKVVWSASSTKGGINMVDRLFGGGGEPMDEVTEEAVNDLINKLFR
jgi:hypothetical protein